MFGKKIVRNKGFTLIELLVVIAIIGLLSSVVLASLNTAREKSRDAKRKSDLYQLKQALELSYDIRGYYPGDGQCNDRSHCWNSGNYIWRYLVTEDQVIPTLPNDPINSATYSYQYEPNAYTQGSCNEPNWGQSCEFTLRVKMEGGGWWYNDSFGVGVR